MNFPFDTLVFRKRSNTLTVGIPKERSVAMERQNELLTNIDNLNGALEHACFAGQFEFAKLLIERGADDWNRGLEYACQCGHKELGLMLLEKATANNDYILSQACYSGCKELALLAMEPNIRTSARGATNWNNGLINACRGGYIEMVELMIEHGAQDFNDGLYHACCYGYKEIVELMIEKGANNLNECLPGACFNNHRDIIMLLIEKGAKNWNKSLEYACEGKHRELVLLLLEKGADIEYCSLPLLDCNIYYLYQKGVSNLWKYEGVVNAFHESCKILPTILDSILTNDLVLEILIF